jgi:uncharacterized phosphatase
MKTVYFVRHGESEANASGIAAGGGLDISLTEDGRMQAKRVGDDLKNKKIDIIVSSPMKRAQETATIIAQTIGHNPKNIVLNELFIERHLGELTGIKTELLKTYYDAGVLLANAETTQAMQRRIIEGLEWLKTLEGQTILLVSHGGVARMIRTILRGEHHNQINSLERIGNSELLEFQL